MHSDVAGLAIEWLTANGFSFSFSFPFFSLWVSLFVLLHLEIPSWTESRRTAADQSYTAAAQHTRLNMVTKTRRLQGNVELLRTYIVRLTITIVTGLYAQIVGWKPNRNTWLMSTFSSVVVLSFTQSLVQGRLGAVGSIGSLFFALVQGVVCSLAWLFY